MLYIVRHLHKFKAYRSTDYKNSIKFLQEIGAAVITKLEEANKTKKYEHKKNRNSHKKIGAVIIKKNRYSNPSKSKNSN